MAITMLCAVVAALRVLPNKSQFFQYESMTLSCEQHGNSSEWRVKGNTSKHMNKDCLLSRETRPDTLCNIDALYPSDSGVYWCESAAGERSNTLSITVNAGPVILESPGLPVTEGDSVTLSCRNKTTSSSSNLTAHFYKDGRLIGSSSAGNMSIHRVSRADEGLYRCEVSGSGVSPGSWLTVRAGHTEPPHVPPTRNPLPVVGVSLVSLISLFSVMLLCLWWCHKGKADPDVPYTDVIVTQEVQPNRIRDVDATPTFYSAVKPGNT